jgi:hypothetical protein
MELVEIRNIVRKNDAVLYRRSFTAEAVLEYSADDRQSRRVEFVLEHTATDGVLVEVAFVDPPNYPLVPVIRILKEHISNLDRTGALP